MEVYKKKSCNIFDSKSRRCLESSYDPKSSSLLHFPEDIEVVVHKYFIVVPQRESIEYNG